jgi:uncharacterized protein YigA (DUF484 family)
VSETGILNDKVIRQSIIENPTQLLADNDVVRALVGAEHTQKDRKVVDLRGVLAARLEERLDLLQDTHQDVVAAAYENLAGTNQIHRAALSLLRAGSFGTFVETLGKEFPEILGVEAVHICLEGPDLRAGEPLGPKGPLRQVLLGLPTEGTFAYFGGEKNSRRKVLLRSAPRAAALIYGNSTTEIRSEAVMRLDLGDDAPNGMVSLGSDDPYRFSPDKATDLLEFLAEVIDTQMIRWLS